jgi:hypothetical protein
MALTFPLFLACVLNRFDVYEAGARPGRIALGTAVRPVI